MPDRTRRAQVSRCSVVLLLLLWGPAAGCENAAVDSAESAGAQPIPAQSRAIPTVGDVAPDFRLWDLHGKPLRLSDYRGRVVFLNFWATWCGPCRVEMPAMEHLYRDYATRGLEILAVSTDPQGVSVTRPFQQALGLTFPILHDSDYRIGLTYGARTLPMTFLVDRRGVITHRIFGARDWQGREAKQFIETLLNRR